MAFFKDRKDPSTDTSHLSKNLGQHAMKAFASVAAANIVANIVGLGGTIVLARLLGPEEFGLMAMLALTIALLVVFENFGLYYATIQKKVLSSDELNFLFWANLTVASVIAALMYFLAPAIAYFFEEPQLVPLAQVLALAFLFRGAANQHAALLNRKLEHGKSSLATVLAVIFATAGAIGLALSGFGVWALVLRQIIEAVVRCIVLWVMSGWIPRLVKWNGEFLSSMKFGASITVSNLMYYLSRNADDILIGKFIGATGLGFYKLSYQVLLLPLKRVNAPAEQIMVPLLSQLQDDAARYLKNYLKAAHILVFIQLPIGVMFIMHAPVLVEIIFGPQWLPAAEPLRWLAGSLLIQGLSNTTGWLLISQARSKTILYWSTFTSVTTVASFIAGLPYGITGVAACYVVVSYVRLPLLLYVTGRSGPVSTRDLYGVLLTHAPTVALFFGLNYLVSFVIAGQHGLLQLVILGATGLSFLPLALVFPHSRAMLMESYGFLKEKVINRKKKRA